MNDHYEHKDNGSGTTKLHSGTFDLRADSLKPGILYLASGVDGHGKVFSSFIYSNTKHISYTHPSLKDRVIVNTDEEYRELCRRTIFWLVSDELQFDDDAYVDASWAPESIAAAREFKLLCKRKTTVTKVFDQDVIEVNNRHSPAAPFKVLDLACGIGGNLVYIGMNSDLAVGIECNPQRVDIARNNTKVHGLTNTFVFQDDLFNFLEEFEANPKDKIEMLGLQEYFGDSLEFDCIHISPPWGGKCYAGSSDERIFVLQENFDIDRAMASMSQISEMVSLYLPRSQSISELVRLASIYGFPIVTLSPYYFNKKVRCLHAHFLKSVECFKRIKFINSDKGDMQFHVASHGIKTLIPSESVKVRKTEFQSSLHMDHVIFCLMKLLDERSSNVAFKLRNLMRMYPLVDILGLASQALQIQYSGGMTRADSDQKRTTGGIFFFILKTQYKELYKKVEKLSQ